MARNCNENDDDNIDPVSVVSNLKNTLKPELLKDSMKSSFEDNSKIGNDTLSLVVEIAKCLVTETCLRASCHALNEASDDVDLKCLPKVSKLMLDFP